MGCGCGRSSGVAPVVVKGSASLETPQIIPSVVAQDAVPLMIMANQPDSFPVASNSNAISQLASGVGSRLTGVPMLRRRVPISEERRPELTAEQTSIPVAKPKSYSILNVIKDTVTGEAEYATAQKAADRLAMCNSCPHLLVGACTKCGCIVKLKVKYEESTCPIGKW